MIARAAFEHAAALLARRHNVPTERVTRRTAGRDGVSLRRRAIYLARVVAEAPALHLATVTATSHVAVIRACQAVENARDVDRALDRELDDLELEMMS